MEVIAGVAAVLIVYFLSQHIIGPAARQIIIIVINKRRDK